MTVTRTDAQPSAWQAPPNVLTSNSLFITGEFTKRWKRRRRGGNDARAGGELRCLGGERERERNRHGCFSLIGRNGEVRARSAPDRLASAVEVARHGRFSRSEGWFRKAVMLFETGFGLTLTVWGEAARERRTRDCGVDAETAFPVLCASLAPMRRAASAVVRCMFMSA